MTNSDMKKFLESNSYQSMLAIIQEMGYLTQPKKITFNVSYSYLRNQSKFHCLCQIDPLELQSWNILFNFSMMPFGL